MRHSYPFSIQSFFFTAHISDGCVFEGSSAAGCRMPLTIWRVHAWCERASVFRRQWDEFPAECFVLWPRTRHRALKAKSWNAWAENGLNRFAEAVCFVFLQAERFPLTFGLWFSKFRSVFEKNPGYQWFCNLVNFQIFTFSNSPFSNSKTRFYGRNALVLQELLKELNTYYNKVT